MYGRVDIHPEALRSLPDWSGPITLAPLTGGITNRNYHVDNASEQFVARIGAELRLIGVNRRNHGCWLFEDTEFGEVRLDLGKRYGGRSQRYWSRRCYGGSRSLHSAGQP